MGKDGGKLPYSLGLSSFGCESVSADLMISPGRVKGPEPSRQVNN